MEIPALTVTSATPRASPMAVVGARCARRALSSAWVWPNASPAWLIASGVTAAATASSATVKRIWTEACARNYPNAVPTASSAALTAPVSNAPRPSSSTRVISASAASALHTTTRSLAGARRVGLTAPTATTKKRAASANNPTNYSKMAPAHQSKTVPKIA
jgi:hypothetical protein